MSNKEIFMKLLLEDDENGREDIKERCLISNEILDSNFITLECNHKFNFLGLYNEVVEQKTKKLLDNSKLKLNEIKCPYCRCITNKLLPYFKYYGNKMIKGVNNPPECCIKLHECTYIDKSLKKCGKNACVTKYGLYCNSHLKYTMNEEELLDNIDPDILKIYKKKSVLELKNELRTHNYKLSGNKGELINRLLINLKHIK
jgi:hypothetical protein